MLGRFLLIVLAAGGASNFANAFEACGSLQDTGGYGPFDYRTSAKQLAIVERFHFTPDVEALKHGQSSTLGGDLDYTLRASPNHHRALMAMANLVFKLNKDKPPGAHYTLSCYFDRAIRFAPNDDKVYMINGMYLARSGKKQEALKQLKTAESLAKDDPNIQYNLGLVYFDLKDYPNARLHARRAYESGFTLPGLRKALEGTKEWDGPVPAPTEAQGAEAKSASSGGAEAKPPPSDGSETKVPSPAAK
jgi:hypothetical protein